MLTASIRPSFSSFQPFSGPDSLSQLVYSIFKTELTGACMSCSVFAAMHLYAEEIGLLHYHNLKCTIQHFLLVISWAHQ